MKIGFFDSGKGGLTVLNEVQKLLPDLEYKYIADSKNCPYGDKSDDELMRIVRKNVEELKDWGANIIVVACNTATTKCIDKLRKEYSGLKFVGTEPAVKLAVNSGAKNILVMATPGTIESERMMAILDENKKPGQQIELLACPGLAEAIEQNQAVDDILTELLQDKKDVDCVVLGCTHYPWIKDEIQHYCPKAILIDGNKGVARQVQRLVENLWKTN